MVEIGKLASAVKLQIAIVIILEILTTIAAKVFYPGPSVIITEFTSPYGPDPVTKVVLIPSLIILIMITWAGYAATKKVNGSAIEGGVIGALIGFFTTMIWLVPFLSVRSDTVIVIGFAIMLIINTVLSFIFGVVGGFIASRKLRKK